MWKASGNCKKERNLPPANKIEVNEGLVCGEPRFQQPHASWPQILSSYPCEREVGDCSEANAIGQL